MKSGLFFCLFFCLLPLHVFSQAEVEVVVFNAETNAPAANVVVRLVNSDIGFSSAKTTQSQGKVQFIGLSTAGTYRVSTDKGVTFDAALSAPFTLRNTEKRSVLLYVIPSIQSAGTVEVRASSIATLNTRNAEVASSLSLAEVQALPVEGRDLTRALFRLPNVVQSTGFYPEAPNVSINGANGLFTNYLVDGMDNNENFLGGQKFAIPIGAVQDVAVLTNNYSAEFGRTGNGVFNVTTKSGANTFTGEGFYVVRPGPALDAASPYAQRDLSGNQVKDGFQRHQLGFGVGGALRKDQTFYYLNAEHTLDLKDNLLNSPQLGVNETVQGRNDFSYLTTRLDQKWSNAFRSALRVNLGNVAIDRQGGGLEGGLEFPSASNKQVRQSALVALQNTYAGTNLVYEGHIQFSRFLWDYAQVNDLRKPRVNVLDAQEQFIAGLGSPGYIFKDIENTLQFQQKTSLFRRNHTFKLGVDALTSRFDLYGGGNEAGSYTVKLTKAQLDALKAKNLGGNLDINDIPSDAHVLNYSIELRPESFGARQNQVGLYVEDQISVASRLNLTVGLRWDYDSLSKGGSTGSGDLNNLAPRFNFNYLLDAQSVIRGGYGLFYDKIVYAIYSDALQQNSTAAGYRTQLQALVDKGILPKDTDLSRITFAGNVTADGTAVTSGYLKGPSATQLQAQRENLFAGERRILNPNGYQNPATHQFSLGYQRQISRMYLFYLDLVHTKSYHLMRLRDLNSPSAYAINPDNVVVRSQAQADATRPIPIFTDVQGVYALVDGQKVRNGIARTITMTETAGKAEYSAASFNILKDRGADNYGFRISYTLSRLLNDTDDINFKAQDANQYNAEWGPSVNDRTHVMSAVGYWYPLKNLTVALAGLFQSGQPINRIPDATLYGTTDLNGDGRSFGASYVGNSDRQPGETRNSGRLPWANIMDFSLRYRLGARKNQVELSADIFNVFNAEVLSGYANNATQSNQIQVGPRTNPLVKKNAGPPRQFQFGIRFLI
ncbi:MAG: TonB-dependent receptor [Bacteroidetes Order II. Incertae sedis bacterium]|nr:TonB-dependent receptor [Bacteroidetes Order II. bacterium]